MCLLGAAADSVSAQCTVDVDGDRRTTAAEIVRAVNGALHGCPSAGACPGDADGDRRVTIDELVRAVDDALQGCRRVFFVRRAGNDEREGETPAMALRTLGAAVGRMAAGDTVVVGPGTYAESVIEPPSGTQSRWVTFFADPTGSSTGDVPGPVVLSARGSGIPGFRLSRARFVIIDGFRVTGGSGGGVHVRQSSQAVTVRHCEIIGNSGDGVLVQDSEDVLVFDNLIWDNSQRGIAVTGSPGARLIHNTVVRNGGQGVFLGPRNDSASSGAFLRNNIVQDNQGTNVEVSAEPPSSLLDLDTDFNLVFPASYAPPQVRAAGDLELDALFIDVDGGDFRLSQRAAGEAEDSPALDTALEELPSTGPIPDIASLTRRSTASDLIADAEPLDLGYHYPIGADPNQTPTTYYVRASGLDGDDGLTPRRAFRRIGRAIALAGPGDTIIVGPGTYRERSLEPAAGTPRRPLVLSADLSGSKTLDPPGPVVIDAGGAETALRLSRARHVVIDGFTITNAAQAVLVRNGSDAAVVRHCEIFGNDDGIVIADSADVLVFDNLIARNERRGVVVGGVLGSVGTRLVSNTITDNDERGVLIGGGLEASPAAMLQNNVVQSNGEVNVQLGESSLAGAELRFNLVFPPLYLPEDTRLLPRPTDLGADAQFVDAPTGDYRLSQTSAGQASTSPAVDAADPETNADLIDLLLGRTTSTSGATDIDAPDLGYHYPRRVGP